MVLVDTSIWVDHLHKGNSELEYLLYECKAATHPYIIGELACGGIKNRQLVLSLLYALPKCECITQEEYYVFLDTHKLYGKGLGFVDVHILASAILSDYQIFTRDGDINETAEKFGLRYKIA